MTAASKGTLSQPAVLEREVRRMLADPRASALSTRFAAQWLRLPDLELVQPDIRQYPDFDEQLRAAMRKETETFFDHLVREDKSVLDLYRADYTYINARLAQHYGIPGVAGERSSAACSIRTARVAGSSRTPASSPSPRTPPVPRRWSAASG